MTLATPSPQRRLLLLTLTLFVAYLCVAIPLPVVPVFVSHDLGFGNVWAGLAVGVGFVATILSRSYAGAFTDRRGGRASVLRGLALYVAGAGVTLVAGLLASAPVAAYAVLLAGRLMVGVGESLVGVSVVAWGVGIVGAANSGKVLSWVGAAMYGALAAGGPIGLFVFERHGLSGAMMLAAALPLFASFAIWRMEGIAPAPAAKRPPFRQVLGRIWLHGAVVGLQGIGFAAIGAFFVLHFLHEHWSHAALGLTAFGGGFVLVRLFLGHLPDRWGGLPVAAGSLAVEAVGQSLIWAVHDPAWALAGAFLTGLGCSMVFPAMGREVVHRVEPHLRATALGAYAGFQDIAYAFTGPAAGLLADRAGYASVFLIGAGAAAAGLLITMRLRRKRDR